MYEHPWHNLTLQLGPNLAKFNQAIKRDPQFLAFTHTGHISTPITFAIKSIGSDDAILFSFNQTFGEARAGKYADALFSLAALPNQWQEIFKQNPKPPYQSIWGLYGLSGHRKSEGTDRPHLDLPQRTDDLIKAVLDI
jgi:hypothetical protein